MVAQWAEKDWVNGKWTRLDSFCIGHVLKLHETSGLVSGNEESPATGSSRYSMPRGVRINLTAANPFRDGICAIQNNSNLCQN